MSSIGLLSPSGWGNLGDAAIQDSVIAALRARLPGVRLTGFTLNPPDTRRRHGISAYPINGFEVIPGYGINFAAAPTNADGPAGPTTPTASTESAPSLKERLRGIRALFAVLRWGNRVFSRVRAPLSLMLREAGHVRMALRFLEDCDLLIVSGGGQLDEEWGGPWGHPYVLAKWALLARVQGVPMVFLSVGTCQVKTWRGRAFLRFALERAAYRSYREPDSRDRAVALTGVSSDPVVPDLAFGVPLPLPAVRPAPSRSVGIFPMAYRDPRIWPTKDGRWFQSYLEGLATLAAELSTRGIRIVWLYSDGADQRVVADVRAILAARFPNVDAGPAPALDSVAALLTALQGLDVVVASRLHAVLLAYVAGTPALALSYDRKVNALMSMLKLDAQCLSIDAATPADLTRATLALLDDRESVRSRVAPTLAGYRRALDVQIDTILSLRRSA